MNNNLDIKALPTLLLNSVQKLGRYSILLFFVLLAIVYGFLIYQINGLSNTKPAGSDGTVSTGTSSIPRIDPTVVNQLEKLKDNSVNVQSIFNDARNNPFHE